MSEQKIVYSCDPLVIPLSRGPRGSDHYEWNFWKLVEIDCMCVDADRPYNKSCVQMDGLGILCLLPDRAS